MNRSPAWSVSTATSGPSPTSRVPRYFQSTFLNLCSLASARLMVPAWTSASASEWSMVSWLIFLPRTR